MVSTAPRFASELEFREQESISHGLSATFERPSASSPPEVAIGIIRGLGLAGGLGLWLIWKAMGPTWRNGTAVGLVLQLGEFQRFPIPDFFMTPVMSQVMTYGTLAFELGFPVLIWIPKLRLPVLVAGLAFHAGLDWVMNVQMFQWLITVYYLLWLKPASSWPVSSAPRSGPACSVRHAR